jgi:proteic killer suppression protein
LEIRFRKRKLQSQYECFKNASRAYGKRGGRNYILRINIISNQELDELKRLPVLRCHPLKGDRLGQWAINLTGFYRLIFYPGRGYPGGRGGIEEVSKHYDDD